MDKETEKPEPIQMDTYTIPLTPEGREGRCAFLTIPGYISSDDFDFIVDFVQLIRQKRTRHEIIEEEVAEMNKELERENILRGILPLEDRKR